MLSTDVVGFRWHRLKGGAVVILAMLVASWVVSEMILAQKSVMMKEAFLRVKGI